MSRELLPFLPLAIVEASAQRNTEADWRQTSTDFDGAVVFCDVSGFTKLSERLAREGSDGAERLVTFLNEYFGQMIAIVTREGGDVMKFAGDALLAVWRKRPSEDMRTTALRAAQCAFALQQAMNRKDEPDRPRLHMGVGAGAMSLLLVGGTYDRWDFLVCGQPLCEIESAVSAASPDLTVMSLDVWNLVRGPCTGEPITGKHGESLVRLTGVPSPVTSLRNDATVDNLTVTTELDAAMRHFVPGAIQKHLERASDIVSFAEMRNVTVLFINIDGLDMRSAACLNVVHSVVLKVQASIYKQAGSINKILLDDKGFVILGGLGLPPLSHEDNAFRAVKAALLVRENLNEIQVQCSIGITSGRVFCGIVGSGVRREYTMMGDPVNTAARLMASAGGNIYCDINTVQACGDGLKFEKIMDKLFKGKTEPIAVYAPVVNTKSKVSKQRKMKSLATMKRMNLQMVGRTKEMLYIQNMIEALYLGGGTSTGGLGGAGGVILLDGERGIGKSRLLEEGKKLALEMGDPNSESSSDFHSESGDERILVLCACADPNETASRYFPWHAVFTELLHLPAEADVEARSAALMRRISVLVPDMTHNAFLLNEPLAVRLPETVSGLQGETLNHRRATMMTDLFTAAVCAYSRSWDDVRSAPSRRDGKWLPARPVMLIFQDVHLADEPSIALLLNIVIAVPDMLVIASTGPFSEANRGPLRGGAIRAPECYTSLRDRPSTYNIRLDPLPGHAIVKLVCEKLGVEKLPGLFQQMIVMCACGNPFFATEISVALRDAHVLEIRGTECFLSTGVLTVSSIAVPPTIQGWIAARLDRLSAVELTSLKTAAVIGAGFSVACLQGVYPGGIAMETLRATLASLAEGELIVSANTPLDAPDAVPQGYLFRNPFTPSVIYSMMLTKQRAELHRAIADWIERNDPSIGQDPIAQAELANHLVQANVTQDPAVADRAISYFHSAAQACHAKSKHSEAARFLEQALTLCDPRPSDRIVNDDQALRAARINKAMADCLLVVHRGEDKTKARKFIVRAMQLVGCNNVEYPVDQLITGYKMQETRFVKQVEEKRAEEQRREAERRAALPAAAPGDVELQERVRSSSSASSSSDTPPEGTPAGFQRNPSVMSAPPPEEKQPPPPAEKKGCCVVL